MLEPKAEVNQADFIPAKFKETVVKFLADIDKRSEFRKVTSKNGNELDTTDLKDNVISYLKDGDFSALKQLPSVLKDGFSVRNTIIDLKGEIDNFVYGQVPEERQFSVKNSKKELIKADRSRAKLTLKRYIDGKESLEEVNSTTVDKALERNVPVFTVDIYGEEINIISDSSLVIRAGGVPAAREILEERFQRLLMHDDDSLKIKVALKK